jgi:hypothetical protein
MSLYHSLNDIVAFMQFNYLVKCMICELAKITLLGVDQMVVIGMLSLLLNYCRH